MRDPHKGLSLRSGRELVDDCDFVGIVGALIEQMTGGAVRRAYSLVLVEDCLPSVMVANRMLHETDMTSLIADTNVGLKGYAQSADASPEPSPAPDPTPTTPAPPSVRLAGAAAKPRATAKVAYRVTWSGVTSGSAAVTLTPRTSRGAVARSRTLQGVSLASPHVWRLHCPPKRRVDRSVAVAANDTGHLSKAAIATLRVR